MFSRLPFQASTNSLTVVPLLPFHTQVSTFAAGLHAGEKALLETILLLLTSIVCVPLVVKTVPGAHQSGRENMGGGTGTDVAVVD